MLFPLIWLTFWGWAARTSALGAPWRWGVIICYICKLLYLFKACVLVIFVLNVWLSSLDISCHKTPWFLDFKKKVLTFMSQVDKHVFLLILPHMNIAYWLWWGGRISFYSIRLAGGWWCWRWWLIKLWLWLLLFN